jgi:hypothetical protein
VRAITLWCLFLLNCRADGRPSLLLYSCLSTTPFRTIKIRSKKPDCPACGPDRWRTLDIESTDYVSFCGGSTPNWEERGLAVNDHTSRIPAIVRKSMTLCISMLFVDDKYWSGAKGYSLISSQGENYRRQVSGRIWHLPLTRVYQ